MSQTPFISVLLLAYNHERYIREAIESLLNQDYPTFELVISEDCSTDNTLIVIKEALKAKGDGPRIILQSHGENVGLTRNFNSALELCSGEIIAIASGDDISLPCRLKQTARLFETNESISLVSFMDNRIDETGALLCESATQEELRVFGLETFLAEGPVAQRKLKLSAASRALKRNVVAAFPPLCDECPAEDTPYILRALFLGQAAVSPATVVYYRVHSSQMSNITQKRHLRADLFKNQYLRDLRWAMNQKLLRQRESELVENWVRDWALFYELEIKRLTGQTPNLKEVAAIFDSNSFTWREKLGLMRRWLLTKPV